jgi:hypothetical protein
MNRFFTLLFAAFCLTAVGQVPDYVPLDGLVAWYPFIVFINQSHGGGFCPSSGLIECEAKPQQALFADFLEGCK